MSAENNQFLKPKTVWLLVLIISVALGAWYMWPKVSTTSSGPAMGMGPGGMRGQATPVRAAEAVQGVLEEHIYAVGTVQAFNTVVVRSRVEGELTKIYFKDGQFVLAGEKLAEIDSRSYEARLEQAQGQLKQVQAQLSQAQVDLNRFITLEKQKSIAKQQVETQRALVQQLQGSVSSAQAAVEDAESQLSYTKIIAPIDGRLGLRAIDEGNLISAANTDGLVTITQTQPIAVSFSLPEKDLARLFERLQLEDSLAVQVFDRQNKLLSTGSILAVDNQINLDTGTVRVKAAMPNLDNRLFPNQFVGVNVLLGKQHGIVIPSMALQTGSIGDFVYVVTKERTVTVRPVTVSLTSGENSLIAKGLQLGDRVVTEGTDRLREGSSVNVITSGKAINGEGQRTDLTP